ncbi:MAG: zf-TFIIB domain-containing protein [Gemmatimonadota bacterium]|nr:zf-TFIIB domain-containing protein [Gemmatimonadota bacterium]
MARGEDQPSRNEDEYFVKQDAELLKQMRAKLDAERAKAERTQPQMKCPRCGAQLQEKQYHHAVVDVCPNCNGMWLDAGEVEIIGKSFKEEASAHSVFSDLRNLFHKSSVKR